MKRFAASAFAALALGAGLVSPALARDAEQAFFSRVEGTWSGPGEIVAGKYKGTKFTCNLAGTTPRGKAGMSLDGTCRVGVFSQKMSASVVRGGKSYKGSFLDGAAGKGLDIIGGNVTADRVVFTLNRKQLRGSMTARLRGKDTMKVTIAVKVDDTMVPVIGIDLNRVDGVAVGSVE